MCQTHGSVSSYAHHTWLELLVANDYQSHLGGGFKKASKIKAYLKK